MNILHTESSNGWGGQEIRILREAEGLRERGFTVIMAVVTGGGLVAKAREKGFVVYEIPFYRKRSLQALFSLIKIIKKHQIDIVNTHSSLDAWLGGIAARLSAKKIVRTRHLSTHIKKGFNSVCLYKYLADYVVTTSSSIIPMISSQARISLDRIRCIATGVSPSALQVNPAEVKQFRKNQLQNEEQILVGTACFVRSWKGIQDLMAAAKIVKSQDSRVRFVIVGGGYFQDYKGMAKDFGVDDILCFTGHLENPYPAIASFDIFTLLSTANEGISQASLQAGFLAKPMITTSIGGLPEVCIDGFTGIVVPPRSPEKVAEAILLLAQDPSLRKYFGENAKKLVLERFTLMHTLDSMQEVYRIFL